jgi:hypothetical protein
VRNLTTGPVNQWGSIGGIARSEVLDDVPRSQGIDGQCRAVGRAEVAFREMSHAIVPGFETYGPAEAATTRQIASG